MWQEEEGSKLKIPNNIMLLFPWITFSTLYKYRQKKQLPGVCSDFCLIFNIELH